MESPWDQQRIRDPSHHRFWIRFKHERVIWGPSRCRCYYNPFPECKQLPVYSRLHKNRLTEFKKKNLPSESLNACPIPLLLIPCKNEPSTLIWPTTSRLQTQWLLHFLWVLGTSIHQRLWIISPIDMTCSPLLALIHQSKSKNTFGLINIILCMTSKIWQKLNVENYQ